MLGTFLFIVGSIVWSIIALIAANQAEGEHAGTIAFVFWLIGLVALAFLAKGIKKILP